MGTTTLYYFFGFIVFIVCLGGLQKWFKLPQPKKDHVGLIVLTTFLSSLLVFILLVTLIPDYLQAANVASMYPLHQPHIALIKKAFHLCGYGRR